MYCTAGRRRIFSSAIPHDNPLSLQPTPSLCSKMKVAHKYPFKYQVNDLAFSKDGSKLYICTGNGEAVRGLKQCWGQGHSGARLRRMLGGKQVLCRQAAAAHERSRIPDC